MPSKTRHAIIMAGGKGTRLAPYTTVLPKPLMPVDDQPILEIVLRQLAQQNFQRVTICVGHLANLIMAFFDNGRRFGVEIEYAVEDVPLGTVGPLRRLELPDEPFLVMNGDILTDLNYANLYQQHLQGDQLLTIAGYRRHVDISLGVLEYGPEGLVTGFREKPRMFFDVSMGVYVMNPGVCHFIAKDEPYGFDNLVLDLMAAGAPPRVVPFDGLWLDIGRHEDYEAATKTFRAHRNRLLASRDEASAMGALPVLTGSV